MKTDILILSNPDDIHYRAVDWGLRSAGVATRLHSGNQFPQAEAHNFAISDVAVSYATSGLGGEPLDLLAPPVVWFRRGHWPVVGEALDTVDRAAALREAEMFVEGARSVAAAGQRWINDPDRELVASRKPYQLHVARRAGLRIPATLMSNDPDRIRAFFESHGDDAILKPFNSMQWQHGDDYSILFARRLKFGDIANPAALRLTGHILQAYVEKAYELRLFCFGDKLLPFRLDSQASERTSTDWRRSFDGLGVEPYGSLPSAVADGIRRYMRWMGLEYGALDFIVDKEGNYVFLECNVSGQFLFVEDWNPEIRMLAEFTQFLTGSLDLSAAQRACLAGLRLQDFRQSAEAATHYAAEKANCTVPYVSRNLYAEQEEGR